MKCIILLRVFFVVLLIGGLYLRDKAFGFRLPLVLAESIRATSESRPSMDALTRNQLDTYFSNFAEANVPAFSRGNISDRVLISFGVWHYAINNPKFFHSPTADRQRWKVPAQNVTEAAQWYFGKSIQKHQSVGRFEYRDGEYLTDWGDGDVQTFAQVTRLNTLGGGLYQADVKIFTAANGWEGNPHGTVEEWKQYDIDDVPILEQVMKATIHRVHNQGNPHFVLIDYHAIAH